MIPLNNITYTGKSVQDNHIKSKKYHSMLIEKVTDLLTRQRINNENCLGK